MIIDVAETTSIIRDIMIGGVGEELQRRELKRNMRKRKKEGEYRES